MKKWKYKDIGIAFQSFDKEANQATWRLCLCWLQAPAETAASRGKEATMLAICGDFHLKTGSKQTQQIPVEITWLYSIVH